MNCFSRVVRVFHYITICLLGAMLAVTFMKLGMLMRLLEATTLLTETTQYYMKSTTNEHYYYFTNYSHKNQSTPISTFEIDFSYPDILPNMTQDLIDFSIAGFAKCGTYFLLRGIFGTSPDVFMGAKNDQGIYLEMHQMAYGNLSGFISYFFPSHKSSPQVKRGFKDPDALVWEPTLYQMSTFFPKAKLIVSIRHPILWFESFYNYRMRTDDRYWSDFNITPHNRIGECSREMPKPILYKYSTCKSDQPCITYKPGFGCTDLANFHVHLSRFGWTPRTSYRELTLLHHRLENTFNFSRSQMFLIESNQLDSRTSENRTNTLIRDLESFLDLKPGSLLREERLPHDAVTTNHVDKSELTDEHIVKRLISICDDEYSDLRRILLKQAKYVIKLYVADDDRI